MEITLSLFNELKRHCTSELLSLIKNIVVSDNAMNEWDITSFIGTNDNLYEILKIFYAFEKLGGVLIYNGEVETFPIIVRRLNNPRYLEFSLYWVHNDINGNVPIFDIGELEIPKILPT